MRRRGGLGEGFLALALLAASPKAAVAQDTAVAASSAPAAMLLSGDGWRFDAPQADLAADGRRVLHEEVTTPALIATLGGRSASVELTVDCRTGGSSVGSVRAYPLAELQGGEGVEVKPVAWLKGAPVDVFDLTQALCRSPSEISTPPPITVAAPPPVAPEGLGPALRPAITTPAAGVASGPLIQLGAFASAALAESQWERLAAADETLRRTPHRIQIVAPRAGITLQRLLAGPFPTHADALAACARARAAGAACLVR